MLRRPPRSPRTATRFPCTTLCRSRGGALPLRAGGGFAVRAVRRRVLLGAEVDGPHVQRKAGQAALLVHADFVQRHLLPHALPGAGRHRSEEHTSQLQSLMRISYAVFCLKKKKKQKKNTIYNV